MDWYSLRQSFGLILQRFTDRAVNVVAVARAQADKRHHRLVTPEHVLLALAQVEPGPGRVTLARLGVRLKQLMDDLSALVTAVPERSAGEKLTLSPEVEAMLKQAKAQAQALGHNYVGTEHFVLALLAGGGPAADFLKARGITVERFREEVLRFLAGT
jgi:ATP-dependent Clp protease ATP-binding subunit ClpC